MCNPLSCWIVAFLRGRAGIEHQPHGPLLRVVNPPPTDFMTQGTITRKPGATVNGYRRDQFQLDISHRPSTAPPRGVNRSAHPASAAPADSAGSRRSVDRPQRARADTEYRSGPR